MLPWDSGLRTGEPQYWSGNVQVTTKRKQSSLPAHWCTLAGRPIPSQIDAFAQLREWVSHLSLGNLPLGRVGAGLPGRATASRGTRQAICLLPRAGEVESALRRTADAG